MRPSVLFEGAGPQGGKANSVHVVNKSEKAQPNTGTGSEAGGDAARAARRKFACAVLTPLIVENNCRYKLVPSACL